MGDSMALSRLLDNLIENALNHGQPPVQISLTSQGQDAVLRVIDHGEGIPENQRKEAIEPFVRLDQARTRSGNVGLGLALAVIISRAHSGSLTLGQSATGGLEVQVNLPLTAPDQITTDNPSS
jgi:two-component system osmolarity sensor histidine kinase EnvZ